MKKKMLIVIIIIIMIMAFLNPTMSDFKEHVGSQNSISPEKDQHYRINNFLIFSTYGLTYCYEKAEAKDGSFSEKKYKSLKYIGFLKNFFRKK